MMAFFDSLIQREIEGWDSQSEESLSSNSASDGEQDWAKVISKIFKNGRHSEETRKFKTNRITQLISKKKNRLAKLAHNKSSSYIQRRNNHQEKAQAHKKRLVKSKALPRKHNGFHKRSYRKSSSDREHRRKKSVKEPRSSKYFTRQSLRNAGEQNSSIDAPSTSTGITSSKSALFRLIEQDSDEEPRNSTENAEEDGNTEEVVDQNNFISILPTPINGTKDILINVLEMANTNLSQNQRSHPVRRSQHQQEEAASHSSNSSRQAVDDGFSDTSDSDLEYGRTPKRRCISAASDSGCCPSSSASTCSTRNASLEKVPYPKTHQACSSSRAAGESSDEEGGRRYEKIRRRARNSKAIAARRKISHDSDSN
ncbi:unnamed protein product [Acanthoscelides obtectus]|nr:unnamed protein product [Acanthoscelides obtectus]CAK1658645.1 hypothetical protein AOBTE_LOCUS21046 [Acanthoscelides obtectus]